MTFSDFVETTTRQYADAVHRQVDDAEREKTEAFAREWQHIGNEILRGINLSEYPEVKIWPDADDMCGFPPEHFELNMQLGDLGDVQVLVEKDYEDFSISYRAELLVPEGGYIGTVELYSIEALIARMRITQLWRAQSEVGLKP